MVTVTLLPKESTQEKNNKHKEKEVADEEEEAEHDNKKLEQKQYISNNYFSIGVDAKVALDFHLARQRNPENFKSRGMNKLRYFGFGSQALFDDSCKGTHVYIYIHLNYY